MENKGSKTKVAKGGKAKAKKISKKVVESDVSDSLSDMSSSVSPLELEPQVKVTKKTKKATKAEQVKETASTEETKSKPKSKAKKSTKVEEVQETAPDEDTKAKSKTKKTKKVKDPNAPKKELNPIMKEMNKFRNEVIGPVVGSKAPKLTIPPFKLAMAAARAEMGLGEKDKNTVETVQKAVELFQNDNSKYLEN